MGMPLPKEKRRDVRRPLMGDLTGRLLVVASGRAIPCLAVDVSPAGLRILAREELPPGAEMFLEFEDFRHHLQVVWCQLDARSKGSYACGLMSINDTDLEQFFVAVGWLDSQSTETWARNLELFNIRDEEEKEEMGAV